MNHHMQRVKEAHSAFELARAQEDNARLKHASAQEALIVARDAFHKAQEDLFVACIEVKR